jgi:hypothetical protein
MTFVHRNASSDDPAEGLAAVDKLVLATVNAPYKRSISAEILARCIATRQTAQWSVHVATFFTEVSTDVMFAFARSHNISESDLAQAYAITRSKTGERNPDLEHAFGSVAAAP